MCHDKDAITHGTHCSSIFYMNQKQTRKIWKRNQYEQLTEQALITSPGIPEHENVCQRAKFCMIPPVNVLLGGITLLDIPADVSERMFSSFLTEREFGIQFHQTTKCDVQSFYRHCLFQTCLFCMFLYTHARLSCFLSLGFGEDNVGHCVCYEGSSVQRSWRQEGPLLSSTATEWPRTAYSSMCFLASMILKVICCSVESPILYKWDGNHVGQHGMNQGASQTVHLLTLSSVVFETQ